MLVDVVVPASALVIVSTVVNLVSARTLTRTLVLNMIVAQCFYRVWFWHRIAVGSSSSTTTTTATTRTKTTTTPTTTPTMTMATDDRDPRRRRRRTAAATSTAVVVLAGRTTTPTAKLTCLFIYLLRSLRYCHLCAHHRGRCSLQHLHVHRQGCCQDEELIFAVDVGDGAAGNDAGSGGIDGRGTGALQKQWYFLLHGSYILTLSC